MGAVKRRLQKYYSFVKKIATLRYSILHGSTELGS